MFKVTLIKLSKSHLWFLLILFANLSLIKLWKLYVWSGQTSYLSIVQYGKSQIKFKGRNKIK